MRDLILAPLRAVRAVLARLLAVLLERHPSLEPWFVRTGRSAARRSRFGGRLYWFAQDALMNRLRRSGHRYRSVSIRDVGVHVDITDVSGRLSYFYSSPYRKQVVDAMMTALKPGDVFLDVGAHHGYFSTIAARVVGPTGRVIAFEPRERMHDELRSLIARNDVERVVELVPTAVDEVSLDDWLAERPGLASRVRCIKIDVQGAESRVIAGMQRLLLPTGVTILCDTSTGSQADVTLERAGYRRHRIERGTAAQGTFLYVKPGAGII
jgi:hypothetical protein